MYQYLQSVVECDKQWNYALTQEDGPLTRAFSAIAGTAEQKVYGYLVAACVANKVFFVGLAINYIEEFINKNDTTHKNKYVIGQLIKLCFHHKPEIDHIDGEQSAKLFKLFEDNFPAICKQIKEEVKKEIVSRFIKEHPEMTMDVIVTRAGELLGEVPAKTGVAVTQGADQITAAVEGDAVIPPQSDAKVAAGPAPAAPPPPPEGWHSKFREAPLPESETGAHTLKKIHKKTEAEGKFDGVVEQLGNDLVGIRRNLKPTPKPQPQPKRSDLPQDRCALEMAQKIKRIRNAMDPRQEDSGDWDVELANSQKPEGDSAREESPKGEQISSTEKKDGLANPSDKLLQAVNLTPSGGKDEQTKKSKEGDAKKEAVSSPLAEQPKSQVVSVVASSNENAKSVDNKVEVKKECYF